MKAVKERRRDAINVRRHDTERSGLPMLFHFNTTSHTSEDWLAVIGFEGVYEVSDRGRIRRVGAARGATVGTILKPKLNNKGYPRVRLRNRGCDEQALVHCLVASAFLGPRPAGLEVNHIDLNPQNPAVWNLEYVTASQNHRHAIAHGGRRYPHGEEKTSHKLSEEDVRAILVSPEGCRALGRRYGVHHVTVSNIRLGRKWKHVQIEQTLGPAKKVVVTLEGNG